jgi:pimeloyl-ACP methyl ester carboxylesterase
MEKMQVFVLIVVLILMIILSLPVILLPLITAVPFWIWIPLALAVLFLIIFQFVSKPVRTRRIIGITGMLIIAVLAVVASQFFASTPPIVDSNGQQIPNAIASLEKVTINDSDQWITIRGQNKENPVLLFLSGGPGGSQLVTERRALGKLEESFIVVNWDQPGAGKSYNAVDQKALTVDRYVNDGLALAAYLRDRFQKEKIFLLGESWGSALGVWMIQKEPDLFYAFGGTGQMVAFLENDLKCYQFAIDQARERGDTKKIQALEKQGPPPYYGKGTALKESAFLLETFRYMNADPNISDDGFNTLQDLAGHEYGLLDKVNWFRGLLYTLDIVYPQLWEVDFRIQAPALEIPVYFLIGRHDVNAPPDLTEAYYQILQAPKKELIWFERSGHNPWVTEADLFSEVLVDRFLSVSSQ